MKLHVPLALALLATGCAVTPEDKTAAHQRRLHEEAEANFLALKAQERRNAPPPPERTYRVAQVEAPEPAPAERRRKPRGRHDDTTYYLSDMPGRVVDWDTPRRADAAARYSNSERRYARELATHPEDLTPEERTWARTRY